MAAAMGDVGKAWINEIEAMSVLRRSVNLIVKRSIKLGLGFCIASVY